MLKPLKEHAQAIRDAKAMMMDESLKETTRVAAMRYLKELVEDFAICDGYVSRINRIEWRVDDDTER